MFAGSLVAIVTPMRPDGAIDFEAWARLLEFHVANGTERHRRRRHDGRVGDAARCGAARAHRARLRAAARAAAGDRRCGHQQHRRNGRARALALGVGRRRPAARDAGLQPPAAGGAVPALRGRRRRRRASRSCCTTCPRARRSTCSRRPWRGWRTLRASSASRRQCRTPRGCASWSAAARATSWCSAAMMPRRARPSPRARAG